jgi:hypothetical protein
VYAILTSKPGQFRTELGDGMRTIESYDYIFCGRKRAHFVIVELSADVKVKIVDESAPRESSPAVNLVPSKFLPKFGSLEAARRELEQLASLGKLDIALVRR